MVDRRDVLKAGGALSLLGAGMAAANAQEAATQPFPGFINTQLEGLVPDSSDDQSEVLQSILDKASMMQGIFIPPGRYRVSQITLPEFCILQGMGELSILEFSGGDFFIKTDASKVINITGLTFDGKEHTLSGDDSALLKISNTDIVDVTKCTFKNSSGSGLSLIRSDATIADNHVENIKGEAGILGGENIGVIIEKNVITECANAGIVVFRWDKGEDNTLISHNRISKISNSMGGTGQYGNGINIAKANNVLVITNHISDCSYSSIRGFSSDNLAIANNTCLRAGETSIYCEFEFEGCNITDNIVDGAELCGISIANFNEGGRQAVCGGNIVKNINDVSPYEDDQHLKGMGISVEADTTLYGNIIDNAKNFGITLGWGEYMRNLTVIGNIIRKTDVGIYVSVVEGVGSVIINSNVMSETKTGGIFGYRWKERVTEDLTYKGSEHIDKLVIQSNESD